MLPPLAELEGQAGALGRHARDAADRLRELGLGDDMDVSVTSLINRLQPGAHQRPSLAVALQSLTELRCAALPPPVHVTPCACMPQLHFIRLAVVPLPFDVHLVCAASCVLSAHDSWGVTSGGQVPSWDARVLLLRISWAPDHCNAADEGMPDPLAPSCAGT